VAATLGRQHCFRIQAPQLQLTCSAADDAACEAWIKALKAASGVAPLAAPRPAYRSRMIFLAAMLCLGVVGLGAGLPLGLLQRGASTPAPVYNWSTCAPIVAGNGEEQQPPPCGACACYQRCLYGATLGLRAPVRGLPHTCGSLCNCRVPPPKTDCSDGLRATYSVDWYSDETICILMKQYVF
jgi:hypothetical protein